MLYEDVLDSQEIQSLRAEYAVEGLDFKGTYTQALNQTLEGVTEAETLPRSMKEAIIAKVAMLLKEELQRFLNKKAEQEGTTWFGRTWRLIWSKIKGNKK